MSLPSLPCVLTVSCTEVSLPSQPWAHGFLALIHTLFWPHQWTSFLPCGVPTGYPFLAPISTYWECVQHFYISSPKLFSTLPLGHIFPYNPKHFQFIPDFKHSSPDPSGQAFAIGRRGSNPSFSAPCNVSLGCHGLSMSFVSTSVKRESPSLIVVWGLGQVK